MTDQSKIFQHRLKSALFYWLWLPGLVVGVGLLIDNLLGLKRWPHGGSVKAIALLVLIVGITLIAWSDRDLRHIGGGTPSPAQPARNLVTSGSYALCRHPMFLGYDLTAAAIVLLIGSPAMLLLCLPMLLAWQRRFLRREEHILAGRFRDDYRSYQARVPFLVPLFRPRP